MVKKMTRIAMLTAVALTIFVLEAQLPPPIALPGIKLGLANAVTLFAMQKLGKRAAAAVLALRICLGAIFAGGALSLLYSACGGMCAYFAMCGALRVCTPKQLWAVSVAGALAHNAGQLAVARLLTGTPQIWWYAPPLILAALAAGLFTGLAVQLLLARR